jgi:transposase-like protein
MPKPPANQLTMPTPAPLLHKVYTREFKLETLGLLQTSGKTKALLERELGLYPDQLRQWERALQREASQGVPALSRPGHPSAVDAELRQLRRENEIPRQERDILKKAIAILSRTPDRGQSSPSLTRTGPNST